MDKYFVQVVMSDGTKVEGNAYKLHQAKSQVDACILKLQ
jgi:hypothetical protein